MFRRIKEMQSLIDESRKALKNAEQKIQEANAVIKSLYEENQQLKEKIKDQDNNIELLVNNLEQKEKALVNDDQSNN